MLERSQYLVRSVLATLIGMLNHVWHTELERPHRGNDQLCLHLIVKCESQDLARALPQSKTTALFGAINQLDLKDIGKENF